MSERGETEVVEGAAVVAILRAAIGAGDGGLFLDLGQVDAQAVRVVADDGVPDRSGRAPAGSGDIPVGLRIAALSVAPGVVGEGDVLPVVVAGDVFGAGHEAAVVVAVEVEALVPGHFT